MKEVVQFITDNDGGPWDDKFWHYIQDWSDADRALCSGHVIGLGESVAEFKKKNGKVTCPRCIKIIKELKKVKL